MPRMNRLSLRLTHLEDRRVPAVATWDGHPDAGGTSADNKWSTAANWVGDVAPQPGDDLQFPAGSQQLANVNDFAPGTAFRSITLTGAYQITGNNVTLTAGAAADVPAGATATLPGLRGSGGLVKDGPGLLDASGDYTGITTVNAGVLDGSLGASGPGNGTVVSDGAGLLLHGPGNADVIIAITEDITFRGQGPGEPQGALHIDNGPVHLSGALTLAGDALVSAAADSGVVIIRGIGETGGSHGLTLAGGADHFADTAVSTYTGPTTLTGNATGVFQGRGVSPVTVATGSTLTGNGTVGALAVTGSVRPGLSTSTPTSPDVLTTGDLTLAGTATFDVVPGFTVVGGQYVNVLRAFQVHGAVRLGGKLDLLLNHPFRMSESATLIDNDGTDPVQGTFDGLPEGAVVAVQGDVALRIFYAAGGGNDVALIATPPPAFAVGVGPGGGPHVKVYSAQGGGWLSIFEAYDPAFRGGVTVATADVTGDGVPDIVTAPGPGGGPVVRVWDGAMPLYAARPGLVREFNAYDPAFRGGVSVAAGDVNGDGTPDIITAPMAGGGPHVKVFSGKDGSLLAEFIAYDPAFRGGVSVAAADVNGDGKADVVTGAGPGGGPHVQVFSGADGARLASFLAYDPAFRGGVQVAAGDVNGDGRADIVTGAGPGGGPHVKAFSGVDGSLLASFYAYDPGFTGGVFVAVRPAGAGGANAIITGAGAGGGPHVEQWEFPGPRVTSGSYAFDPSFTGGVFVG